MDGLSAHDEMARAIRTAIGMLEDEEMALPETRVEAALLVLREVAHLANGPAVDLDAEWSRALVAMLRERIEDGRVTPPTPEELWAKPCHACDEDSRCPKHQKEWT